MFSVRLITPSGQYTITIPEDHPELLGEWLKAMFSSLRPRRPWIPMVFTLEVS